MTQDRISANAYSIFIGTDTIPVDLLTLDKAKAGINTIANLKEHPLSKEEQDGLRTLFARHAPADVAELETFLSH